MSKWFSVKSPESNPVSPFKNENRRYRVRLENAERKQIDAYVLITAFPDGGLLSSVYAYAPRKGELYPLSKEDLAAVTVDLGHVMERAPKAGYGGRYLDMKGAPWDIGVAPIEDGKLVQVTATSGGYEGATVSAENLESLVRKIDEYALSHFRLTPSLQDSDLFKDPTQVSLSSFKDSMGVEWKFYELKDATRGALGFYAKPTTFADPRLIGPNSTLTQAYRDTKDYTTEKSSLALAGDRSDSISTPLFDETAEEPEWYEKPWVWAVGGGALLLLLGGVIKASRSKAEHTRPRPLSDRAYSNTRSAEYMLRGHHAPMLGARKRMG